MRALTSRVTSAACATLGGLATLASVAACAGSSEQGGVRGAENPLAPSASSAESPNAATPGAKLAPAPTTLTLGQFWPTRICTRGAALIIVENRCVCDSKMTCSVSRRGGVLDLHVGMSQEICKDCGAFSAICTVPVDARPRGRNTKKFRLTIDGKPVLDALELPRSDAPAIEHCYE